VIALRRLLRVSRFRARSNDVVISLMQQQPSDEIVRRGRDQCDREILDWHRAQVGQGAQ